LRSAFHNFQQQVAHDLPGLGVERPNGSSISRIWIADQHLREANSLALPARQHMRITIAEPAGNHGIEPALRPLQREAARRAGYLQPMATLSIAVFQETAHRLKTDNRPAGLRPTSEASKIRTVPITGLSRPAGDVKQGRFSASGGPDDATNSPCSILSVAFRPRLDAVTGQAECHRRVVQRDPPSGFVVATRIPSKSGICISACEG